MFYYNVLFTETQQTFPLKSTFFHKKTSFDVSIFSFHGQNYDRSGIKEVPFLISLDRIKVVSLPRRRIPSTLTIVSTQLDRYVCVRVCVIEISRPKLFCCLLLEEKKNDGCFNTITMMVNVFLDRDSLPIFCSKLITSRNYAW